MSVFIVPLHDKEKNIGGYRLLTKDVIALIDYSVVNNTAHLTLKMQTFQGQTEVLPVRNATLKKRKNAAGKEQDYLEEQNSTSMHALYRMQGINDEFYIYPEMIEDFWNWYLYDTPQPNQVSFKDVFAKHEEMKEKLRLAREEKEKELKEQMEKEEQAQKEKETSPILNVHGAHMSRVD